MAFGKGEKSSGLRSIVHGVWRHGKNMSVISNKTGREVRKRRCLKMKYCLIIRRRFMLNIDSRNY